MLRTTHPMAQPLAPHRLLPSMLQMVAIACLLLALGGPSYGQEDDPDGLLTPAGLQRQVEAPPQAVPADKIGDETVEGDVPTPRTTLGDDARETVVGRFISYRGGVLTILDDGKERKFTMAKEAKVLRDGEQARLTDLLPQDVVRVMTTGDPKMAGTVVAASPPTTSNREPDPALRQQRQHDQQVADQVDDLRRMQGEAAPSASGGRIWVVTLDGGSSLARSGVRAGDVIIVADQQMMKSGEMLNGLSSGLFPLQMNTDGQAVLGTIGRVGTAVQGQIGSGVSATGVGVPGVVVPGTTTGVGNAAGINQGVVAPQTGVNRQIGNQNIGPPIGRRPNGGDRNFGPPIGTPNPGEGTLPQQGNTPPVPGAGAGVQTPGAGAGAPMPNAAGAGAAGAGAAAGSTGAAGAGAAAGSGGAAAGTGN